MGELQSMWIHRLSIVSATTAFVAINVGTFRKQPPVAFELGCWFVGGLPTFLAWWIRVLALSSICKACAWGGYQHFWLSLAEKNAYKLEIA